MDTVEVVGATVVVSLFGLLVATVHIFALYLLHKTETLQSNQKLYLVHISALEVIIIALSLLTLYVNIWVNDTQVQEYSYLAMVSVTFPWMYILTMFTVDRFLQVYLNLKYCSYMTSRRRKFVIGG
eukprot:UN24043